MNLEPFHDLPFDVEMTEDKDNKVVQLAPNGKKPLLGKDKHTADFLPFRDPKYPTGINCNYYKRYQMFLSVLDIDDPLKYESEMYLNLEFKDTFTRESKNGLHVFFWSKEPLKLSSSFTKKDGTKLKTDYRGCTAANPNSWGHHVRYYPEFESNCMEVEIVDINEIVEDFLIKNDCVVKLQAERFNNNVISVKVEKDLEVFPYIEAIALYFHYKIRAVNPKWVSGYRYSFQLGLKLSGYIETIKDANAFANRLMELSGYSKPYQWIQNFMNGYITGDEFCRNNFGGDKLTRFAINFYINKNLTIDEYAQKMYKYDLDSYVTVIKNVLKLRGD